MNNIIATSLKYVLILLVCVSCNNTFEPMQEDHPYAFSMYGFLDIHADTQFVRIMPIGKTLLPSSTENPNSSVTILRFSTQETMEMVPVKIGFGTDYAYWNYHYTEPILPNEEYQIKVIDESGQSSSVEIIMPNPLDLPEIEYTIRDESGLVTGNYSDSLVQVGMYYEYVWAGEPCDDQVKTLYVSHLNDGIITNSTYRFRFRNQYGLNPIVPHRADVLKREFHISTATESWPDMQNFSLEEMALPTNLNNVTNGTGFVAGIARRVVVLSEKELEPCEREPPM